MKWLKKRIGEPSSWGGLGLLVLGLGQLFDINEAAPLAEVIGQTGQAVVSGDWVTGLGFAITGALSVLLGEKGEK